MSLVQELVRQHHGQIRVRSLPGSGTAFTVWIPVTPPGRPSPVPAADDQARGGPRRSAAGEPAADDYIVKPFLARELIARVDGQITLAWDRLDGDDRSPP